jgi:hypothetical protein
MSAEHSYKATVRELREQKPGCAFFRELIDTTSFKCYGTQQLDEAEVQQALERFVGFYGRAERTFTAPFDIQRGHKIVTFSASKRKPLQCWEHIYAQI